ncbi:UDP-N-acetylenolpyruvoylglucosamine reductase [Salinicola sp. MH3R3-1]|uniref:UDP-N-acetylmuramate dehydrogenase n=1 Tax=Salinicola sp. MH3R3-1 TaxID=1928762 RepID=UPI00094E9E7D|nr:UDP-N-acetylmuramate dehydrogenase [Salinicola sp. MH3R3-1]OLO09061.1 UDP-N-acetylenolpyruvoylglucosamine reductase [Salinicola sp. MH3R3-1]
MSTGLDVADGLAIDRDLSHANTLALPSRAERFWHARSESDVVDGLQLANAHGWPITVLGGGSNLLLPPAVGGLTLRADIEGVTFRQGLGDTVHVEVGAGVGWHALVEACVARELWGIENLALIPGLAGAAPIQNIGAYGVELADVIDWVELVDRRDARVQRLDRDACGLGYRDSVFKRELADQVVITRLGLTLSTRPRPQLDYGILRERVSASPSARDVFEAVCAIRREKLPDPIRTPNAGSFFKNPLVTAAVAARLLEQSPSMPHYPQPDGQVKLAAGWLIDQCGLKGHREGAFGVHDRQALVLVHFGGGTLEGLLAFADTLVAAVQARFGVVLEREPRCVEAPGIDTSKSEASDG